MASLSNRAPEARNPIRLANEIAETALIRPTSAAELLMTSVPPNENQYVAHIQGIFSTRIPLRTVHIDQWPRKMDHLQCLHCGGHCNAGPPVPVVRQYESQIDQYWVYGPFCRPCCALGYICETDSTSKQLSPTVDLLRRFFGLKDIFVAPPRAAHRRFGGPLSDGDFYGLSGYMCLTTLQPPFVTFANYVVGVHQQGSETFKTSEWTSTHTLLPQSAGRLVGLTRPTQRATPLAEKRPTGKSPMLLEFLATLTSSKDVKDQAESIDVRAPKRKRLETVTTSSEQPMFLKQYVKQRPIA
jgi:hypothetical protein